jgi:dihydrolipoamide dehydrogenase
MEKYDVCVLGGGPSGYAAAMRALDFGKKVLLIEKHKLGGAGIYNGALTSKTLWELSREIAVARKKLEKYNLGEYPLDFTEILNEVNEAVYERRTQMEHHNYGLKRSPKADLFDCVYGEGKLTSANHVEVATADGVFCAYAENIVLATGSRPRYLPNVAIDEQIIMTSDGISNLTELPRSIVIVGAGVIGCEFTTIFANMGKTKVYLVANAPRILPTEDEDITEIIEENMLNNGVTIHHSSRLERMEVRNGMVEYEISKPDGSREIHTVEKALISIGRLPNTQNIGLEEIGVAMDKNGYIIDNDTRSSVSNIYAVGDLTSDIALVNVGEVEGRHAIEKMYGNPKDINYHLTSTIMFLNPEAAAVGLNEKQAMEKNIPYKVVILDYMNIARAVAMRQTQGFFKILVTDDDEMKILGMRALGEHASSAIQAVSMLISMNKGVEELAELIHPHPSIIEGVQECVRMLLGTSIYKPSIFRQGLKCCRVANGICEDLIH